MILNFKKEIRFPKNFVDKNYYSEFQLKTIDETYLRILNIVAALLEKPKGPYLTFKRFTITNLWISIFKIVSRYFIFIIPSLFTQNDKPLDLELELSNLIQKVVNLIHQVIIN